MYITVHTVVYSAVYSIVFSTMYTILLLTICRKQGRGCSSGNKSANSATFKSGYSSLYIKAYTVHYFLEQYMCVGCPGTYWDVTVKTRLKLLCQNKSYGGHKFMAYFSLLTILRKKTISLNVFRMISSTWNLNHKIRKLNIWGQKQIIQPVTIVSGFLGHFVPIYA